MRSESRRRKTPMAFSSVTGWLIWPGVSPPMARWTSSGRPSKATQFKAPPRGAEGEIENRLAAAEKAVSSGIRVNSAARSSEARCASGVFAGKRIFRDQHAQIRLRCPTRARVRRELHVLRDRSRERLLLKRVSDQLAPGHTGGPMKSRNVPCGSTPALPLIVWISCSVVQVRASGKLSHARFHQRRASVQTRRPGLRHQAVWLH